MINRQILYIFDNNIYNIYSIDQIFPYYCFKTQIYILLNFQIINNQIKLVIIKLLEITFQLETTKICSYINHLNIMSSNSSIVDWLISLGISNLLTTDDILSGNTLHMILKKTIDVYKNEFALPSSAVNKMNNWNNLIKYLQKINIKITSEDKNLILHGNQNIVYNILSQVKSHVEQNRKQIQVDINKIDHRADPKQSKSLLELFILVIIKNLGLNAKQSVALLSNDSKYLAHILAKGFKEEPNPVMNLLKDFQNLQPQIHQFCINKENQVFFLKSIKPGLISKFIQISSLSLSILQQFCLSTNNPFQVFKVHLIPTIVLQYRRHPSLLNDICKTIIKLSKYTKSLLTVMTSNMNQKQLLTFCLQILTIAQDTNQSKSFYSLTKIQQIVTLSIDSLSDSNIFTIALLLLCKFLQTNFQIVANQQKHLFNIVNNLQHLAINKACYFANYINGLFTLLNIFGSKKNLIAPLIFKLCTQKYKLTINQDQSNIYAHNFLNVLAQFPSIPNTMIVDAIAERYQIYKQVISQLDIEILRRIAFGIGKRVQDNQSYDQQNETKLPDQKTALKIYNILSKYFFQDVSNSRNIADIMIFIFLSNPQSQFMFDLNMKMVKVSLAVHFANIRKLNMSKSIVQGLVKLDQSNAFIKRKNLDIQYFLQELLHLRNQNVNRNIEPLLCYSFIQSDGKNKKQSQGLARVLSILGNLGTLVKRYQEDVKMLHQDKKGKRKPQPTAQLEQIKNTPASTDLLNKKKLNPGQNYSMYLSKISKISFDAQKGLQKYQKLHLEKLNKQKLQEIKIEQELKKKQQMQKKYTTKILQKGVRIDPKNDRLEQYLYQFNFKQNQLKKQQFYDLTSLHLFNPDQEEANDLQALKYVMKRYNRILKVYFSNYGGKLRPNSIQLFDQIAQKQSLMQVANVWKLFKDYFLDQFMTVRQAQYLVQKCNTLKKKSYNDTNLLDFQAFQDFIIQASLTMFSRAPKNLSGQSISYMVEQIFYRFKLYATQNKIDIRLFDDENSIVQQDQSIADLNLQLKKNPDYILPEGYKKIVQKKVQYYHSIALDAFDQSYSDVLDVLDQICYEKLGFHFIEPFSQVVTNIYAKNLLSKKKQQKNQDFKEKYFSLNVKRQLANYSNQDRSIAREAAFCISEIIDCVEFGKKMVPKNKYNYLQQENQRQKVQQQVNKKRQRRDEQIKQVLKRHKQQKSKQKDGLISQKLKQQKKLQDDKKKREKYQQELKKKVEEYQQKKQQQKKKAQQEQYKKKQKEQQQFDKKRLELTKVAKQIQQKKEIQKKQQEKKNKQQQLLKQKSKKNLKIRQSPKPLKKTQNEPNKNTSDPKKNEGQPTNQKQNKNISTSPKQPVKKV